MPHPKILVIGLGNPLLGDDGFGWQVAHLLEGQVDPARVEVDSLAVGGLSLMERMVGYERVILVDALVSGTSPIAALRTFPLEALADPGASHATSAHDTSLQTALALGREMGVVLPQVVRVVAVEAHAVFDFDETLSAEIGAAVPAALEMIQTILQEFTQEEE